MIKPPKSLRYHRDKRLLAVVFADGETAEFSTEFLRVHSPSAEVQGHGGVGGMLVGGRREVGVERIEPVGNYAIRIHFDDGHNTGLYTWPILQGFAKDQEQLWQQYLERLDKHQMSREPGDVTKLSALLEVDRKPQ